MLLQTENNSVNKRNAIDYFPEEKVYLLMQQQGLLV